MATRVFADEELERLRGFPEISREELFRYFTLTPADLAFVDPGRGRGPADRLGLSIALPTRPESRLALRNSNATSSRCCWPIRPTSG
ncbi:DUF4158 domain-containing protein [Nocardia cerradoensis]|uniref:DUF4158 domain-containing protein n=1 Tax=Nocardia cerradoensis TaxID=85688 RepID=UPI000A308D88|nr:DUF4158 domain-containing protein [Nocardia cerradoensis]